MLNKTFPVLYQTERFFVDPALLFDASQRFRDLILERGQNIQNILLKIEYNGFTPRNVENFLNICQNQQTDVQNSELKEICLIAELFKANQILNKGLTFIRENFDSSFCVPSNQFEESNGYHFLIIEEIPDSSFFDHGDFNELGFDDSCEQIKTESKDNNKENNEIPKKKLPSVCYQITSDNPFMKCPRFYLIKNGKILYMAKQKNDEIYIGQGENFHISENKFENTARITRDSKDYNIVNTEDQEFKIKFLRCGEKYSLDVTFTHKGCKFNWIPKKPKNQSSFNGEFKHKPIPSKKNIILQNQRNHPTFILRKMTKKTFECECHQNVNPIIAFSITISEIVGPISV